VNFRQVIALLEDNGFSLHRQGATSHRIYRAEINGEVKYVTIAVHRLADDVKPKTLASIIRQSGLPKSAFR
jgi:predicted RNA binding protein YcfA (HicA-like mRNA interferase family)